MSRSETPVLTQAEIQTRVLQAAAGQAPVIHTSADPTLADARTWLAQGDPVCIVRIAQGRGSLPRPVGTRMLVSRSKVLGSIGGGHLEFQALQKAQAWLDRWQAGWQVRLENRRPEGFGRSTPTTETWSLSLGPSLGQCCGGALTLAFEPLSESVLADWADPPPRFRLNLFGAGHVGRALVHVLTPLACPVRWIDEREAEFAPAMPLAKHIQAVATDDPLAEVAAGQPGDAWLVLTHSHALDMELVQAILRRGDCAWLGLIGSATKRARFMHRLQERGLGDLAAQRLCCPVGLPGLEGKEPAVIAVSVVAQLLQTFPPA